MVHGLRSYALLSLLHAHGTIHSIAAQDEREGERRREGRVSIITFLGCVLGRTPVLSAIMKVLDLEGGSAVRFVLTGFTLFFLTLNAPQRRKLSISNDWILFFSDLFYLIDASNIFFLDFFSVIDFGVCVGYFLLRDALSAISGVEIFVFLADSVLYGRFLFVITARKTVSVALFWYFSGGLFPFRLGRRYPEFRFLTFCWVKCLIGRV